MATYYIPVTEIGLVEFLSSGYVGISKSKIYYTDIHTQCWPSTAVLKELEAGFSDIFCEIVTDEKSFILKTKTNGKSVKMFQLKAPTSIGEIKRIIFSSQKSLSEFVSKFHYMEDLNISDFELVYETSLAQVSSQDSFIASKLKIDSISLSGSTADISEEKDKFLAQSRTLFSYIASFFKFFPVDSTISLDELQCTNDCSRIFKSIACFLGCNSPTRSLELMLGQYWSLCHSNQVDARTDQIEILERISEKLELVVGERSEVSKAKGFISRVINIFMGMDSHPDLSGDSPEKSFQFGFYISLIMKELQDLPEMKNRFRFSAQVEAIASFLFLLRSHFSQVSAETFNLLGAKKKDWSLALSNVYRSKKADVLIKFRSQSNSLDLSCTLFINDIVLLRFVRGISAVEGQVISTVQRFNVEPTRDIETGFLSITTYVSNNPVRVLLQIVNFKDNHHVNEVNIQCRSRISHDVLSKAKSRLKLLKMTSRLGVVTGVDDSGYLVFSRLQMVDTMDKDELWHHIEQVADALALFNLQEW